MQPPSPPGALYVHEESPDQDICEHIPWSYAIIHKKSWLIFHSEVLSVHVHFSVLLFWGQVTQAWFGG